ncbi:hypothetical protein FPV67DRAFT_1141452 [Lyophyllum atratum]|nr:hypothetical protein FPV67DRAFT_1141452 [Lyophyllum atratum]
MNKTTPSATKRFRGADSDDETIPSLPLAPPTKHTKYASMAHSSIKNEPVEPNHLPSPPVSQRKHTSPRRQPQPFPRLSPIPVKRSSSLDPDEEQKPTITPSTPPRKRAKPNPVIVISSDDEGDANTDYLPSPPSSLQTQKKTSTGPKKSAPPKKEKKVPKPKAPSAADLKAAWHDWCLANAWKKDIKYKQGAGWKVIHSSEAKKYFGFKPEELATVPHEEFPNEHNPKTPGRSYRREDILKLAYRKHAALKGVPGACALHGNENEAAALEEGKKLYEANLQKLEARYCAKNNGNERPGPVWRSRRSDIDVDDPVGGVYGGYDWGEGYGTDGDGDGGYASVVDYSDECCDGCGVIGIIAAMMMQSGRRR